jgi:hypothetical protein
VIEVEAEGGAPWTLLVVGQRVKAAGLAISQSPEGSRIRGAARLRLVPQPV